MKNYFLHQSAKDAFKAYVRAYDSHHLKTIFDVHTLNLTAVAHSFGFKVPPNVDLSKFFFLYHSICTNYFFSMIVRRFLPFLGFFCIATR